MNRYEEELNQLNRLKRVETNCIASNHSPYFQKLPKRSGENHLIFQPEFPVFPGKWKVTLVSCC